MKNNTLVLIDWGVGFITGPIIIVAKLLKKIASKFYRPKRNGRLIIKFLGAGNYVAMSDIIDDQTTLISASSNKLAISHFLKTKNVFYIDDSSLLSLATTSLGAIFFVLKGSYCEVINFETESNFSKLLASIARADQTLGITNVHKSFMDMIIYDRYLVNPTIIGKSDSLALLTNFRLIQNEHAMAAILKSQHDFFQEVRFKKPVVKIAFAPTGSDTDTIRRASPAIWKIAAHKLLTIFPDAAIDLYFPSQEDMQFEQLSKVFANDQRVSVRVGSYSDYVAGIKNADLVLCIDSQTLHVANYYQVPSICFFGPSSPYGVNHTHLTYPISLGAACSPCRHKYFEIPCGGKALCMNFSELDLSVLDRLDRLCI